MRYTLTFAVVLSLLYALDLVLGVDLAYHWGTWKGITRDLAWYIGGGVCALAMFLPSR